jgi:hypothetical protein
VGGVIIPVIEKKMATAWSGRSLGVLGNLAHRFGCVNSAHLEDCDDGPLFGNIFNGMTCRSVPIMDNRCVIETRWLLLLMNGYAVPHVEEQPEFRED